MPTLTRRALPWFSMCIALLIDSVTCADDAVFPLRYRWGKIVATTTAVELHINSIPANSVIAMPRFNSPYQQIFLQSDPNKTPLEFRAEVGEWQITLPKSVGDSAIAVIETVGKPQLLTRPFVIKVNQDGGYELPAHFAIVHGEQLRYEPQPHKNTIGYWTVQKDWCEWKLSVSKPGQYTVHILQGCGKGHGGSEVEIKIGQSQLAFTVEDTGHFQNFEDREVGRLDVASIGEHSLQIRSLSKANVAVMDVRHVRLVPVP